MNSDIRVTVIIPTYNRKNYLLDAVKSIVEQTVKPFEILIIDDGSNFCVKSLLGSYVNDVQVIVKENGGKPTAVNLGIDMAQGSHIWVFDDDDIAINNYLQVCVECLQKSNNSYVFGWHYAATDDEINNSKVTKTRKPNFSEDDSIFVSLLEGCSFAHNAIIADKKCYTSLSGFDTTYPCSEDYEFQLRLAQKYSGKYIDVPAFIRRVHDGERGGKDFTYSANQRRKKFIEQDKRFISHYLDTLTLREYAKTPSVEEDKSALITQKLYICLRLGMYEYFAKFLQQANTETNFKPTLSIVEQKRIIGLFTYLESELLSALEKNVQLLHQVFQEQNTAYAFQIKKAMKKGLIKAALTKLRGLNANFAMNLSKLAIKL